MKEFAVTSKSFTLYEAFKKEAESRGWVYNTKFNDFIPEKSQGNTRCLYFSNNFSAIPQTPAFSFSNTSSRRIVLEENWSEAIALLDQIDQLPTSKTHVTLQEIADWKGVSVNDLTVGL